MKKYFKEFDYPLFITYFLLSVFGLVMIYSAGMMSAVNRNQGEPELFYKKQLLNVSIGLIFFAVGVTIPYKKYAKKRAMQLLIGSTAVLLLAVHFIGVSPGNSGAQSWLDLWKVRFQPSEYAKLTTIICLSVFLANLDKRGTIDSIKSYKPFVFLFAALIFSLYLEPDMGAILLFGTIVLIIILSSNISMKTISKGLILLTPFIIIGVIVAISKGLLTEKRLGRLSAFTNPFEDAENFGLQIINGYYAIGLGGVQGAGLGQSVMKLGYIPEPHTDFIMAIISEELGAVGVLIVLGGLGFIVLRAFVIGIRSRDPLARLMAIGIGSWIGVQTFVNIGGLSGLIPLTGVTLPFISYGGTSLVFLSFAMGLLINISMFVKKERKTI
ncbi:cell division protein FtsW [Kurthia zopfii]|uniref:Probable peptidoglycan glycosyltransferase FtsW n=1 Tax=Kurthia zopfii TaxID=1650 RepID=A0A8B4Q7Z0_9BACL|nr:FtsW/RodA/SpoVE family cell cycle protein [Kurthia zopfii]TDR36941.1 cell division-specific peptidoglycan biosynthesis regulator FtsW [Kurthia zopfii]GEK31184.1 cell division protein FtsW [Kurthia zopfii]STX08966.1 Cell division protein FtsW [Kurthia zopfii]